ncbi:F-BAR domain only protein 2 isoform X2 [Dendroctonus ponderosae]|uniref:F-BAR domain only protein 2 isoform X2 n=1 Tax=Dendroctonus ponderosae TaxID=77166 RepID=UPI0020351C8B|nr:F-BAR domain only protein 2 isoform X2 [Dendroctonus ponderosae]
MTVDFNDYFWGEKNNGFDVLYHNMKFGLNASKDFAEFLRERSSIEENNSKLLTKLAKQAGSCCSQGTFAPLWQVVKASAEKLSALHVQTMQKLTDLVKEVGKYAEELHKKHKSVKEEESGTLEVVQAMQTVTLNVQKSKDVYNQRFLEFERLKKENASAKDLEKSEQKFKRSHEDYKGFVEKYCTVKEEFEKRMSMSVKNFQELEISHLIHMKEFLNYFADVIEWAHGEMGKVHKEFRQQCVDLTIDQLLEQFVKNKSTGLERPGILDLEEPVLSPTQETEPSAKSSKREGNGPSNQTVPTHANKPSRRTTSLLNLFMSNSQGFLRSRRDKGKKKKTTKKQQTKDSVDNQSNKEEKSDMEEKDDSQKSDSVSGPPNPSATQEVDDDGYVIRPTVTQAWNEKTNFYSSSDSGSDDEPEVKLHVEIKPLNNGSTPMSASVDELRATVENIYLCPTGGFGRRGSNLDNDMTMKRSQSVSQQIGKPSTDLLGLSFVQSPTASNASTPTSSHPYAPLQSPSQLALNSPTLSIGSKYAELGDIFSEDNETQMPKQPSRQTPTPTSGYMSIPRPPSRRSDPNKSLMQQNSNISRADSINSLEFRTACVPVGVSRGPSPLTIGMADTIPLAVAFHEIVHSYFRGAEESRCQVKMSGEMMLSFPAGIVTILASNPNPAKLIFRVKNTRHLSSVLPNENLVSLDPGQSSTDSLAVEFNMSALSSLLRKQSEQNPNASYFNVDILKYQIKAKPGANSCPLQLVAYWKCANLHTDLKIEYKYNLHAMSSPTPLLNVSVSVPVDGVIKTMQSKPQAHWAAENNRLVWKFTELSQHSENNGVGSMLARYDVENGPGTPSTISAQFNCEGTTLSGIDFQLVGLGYRLSLVKRRFVSGKYICDGDRKYNSGLGTPNTVGSGDPQC